MRKINVKKAVIVQIIAVVVFITMIPANAYALCRPNKAAEFCTDHGSYYKVTSDGVARWRYYDDPNNGKKKPKNIYFGSDRDVKEFVKEYNRASLGSNVDPDIVRQYLDQTAKVNEFPVDLILGAKCEKINGDSLHEGHKVTKLNPPGNTNTEKAAYCKENYG